ncbi:MAG: ABC transporter substrate-binding protein [Bacteroidia bacterium]
MRKLPVVILSTIYILSSCTDVQKPTNQQVFSYNQESGISSLDPAFARDQASGWAVNMLFNGLIQLDAQLQLQPAIARHWQVDEAGTTYRFWLRTDVRFHENKCFGIEKSRFVSAGDFVYSFNRLIDPKLASPGAWIFSGKLADTPFVAINDSLFEIRLRAPYPPLAAMLSMGYCSVLPKEAIEVYGLDFRANPVGTGPFKMAFWEENEALVLHKNENYFETDSEGRALPYLDAVVVHFLPDKQSAFLAFLQGKLDFISGIDPAFKDEVLQRDGSLQTKYQGRINLQRAPYLNTEYLGILLNQEKAAAHPLLQEKRVRHALNLAIDRRQMMQYLRNNVGIAGTAGLLPPGLPGFDSSALAHFEYAPEKAKTLLREAGIKPGELQITLETNPAYLDLCIFIQRQWQNIGVKLEINTSPGPTLRQLISKGEVSLFRASWIADYPDAENYLALAYGPNAAPSGPNYTQFNHIGYNRLYEMALQENNDSLRADYYQQMDAIIREEAPFIVLYYDQVLRLLNPEIAGLETNAMNVLDLKMVRKLHGRVK